jgi:ADP-ribose pyrophosphatase
MTDDPIRRVREVLAYDNPYVKVYDDEVAFPDGSLGRYLRITAAANGPGVVILPLYNGSVGLVRTYRYPVGTWQWALPRGFSHDADPLVTASAELREELGVQATDLRLLGTFTPDSGVLDQRVAVVVATVDNPRGTRQDVREVAESRWITTAALWTAIASKEIDDGMTMAAMTLARAHDIL